MKDGVRWREEAAPEQGVTLLTEKSATRWSWFLTQKKEGKNATQFKFSGHRLKILI